MKIKLDEQSRWLLAGVIILTDFALFFAPLGAIFLAYLIIARPTWFLEFVKNLYESDKGK